MEDNVKDKMVIAAQFSSVHSPDERLQPGPVNETLSRIAAQVPIDILIAGWEEKPDLFRFLTGRGTRISKQVFLWYPFLSDFPGFDRSHLAENIYAGKSEGWGGYAGTGINETFRQACPNNPEAVSTSMSHLLHLLSTYEFDGVFIDKIRFPSMANGLKDVFSCFCPYCVEEAGQYGLDLEEVRRILKGESEAKGAGAGSCAIPRGAAWLEHLVYDCPPLNQFIRFRADSITRLVEKISALTRQMGRQMSLDVFSPCLAPLVGQDLNALALQAEWLKPMIYRFGNGPSSLRSEIPALVHELSGYLKKDAGEIYEMITSRLDGLSGCSLRELETVAPLSLIQAEAALVKALLPAAPVYLGLETVHIPGKMEVLPEHVSEILEAGRRAGVNGYVLSWDLYHTPLENVLPLKQLL